MSNEPIAIHGCEKVSPTARVVAYARFFSDIPFSQEIWELIKGDGLSEASEEIHFRMSPYFEARSKALTQLLRSSGIRNVLEVASGLSPRGILMTADPTLMYIEADLPDMLKQKQQMLQQLLERAEKSLPENLQFSELNVFDAERFREVVHQFPPGPIAIGHEGLLAYYSREEKHQMAEIVRGVLQERGGFWITPDIYTLADLDRLRIENSEEAHREIQDQTNGRGNYRANAFDDLDDIHSFLSELGFSGIARAFEETVGIENIASGRIGLDPDSVRRQLQVNTWELRLAK